MINEGGFLKKPRWKALKKTEIMLAKQQWKTEVMFMNSLNLFRSKKALKFFFKLFLSFF
jgi:hypothetical protein